MTLDTKKEEIYTYNDKVSDYVKNPESNNSFEIIEKKIENVFKRINESLVKTSLMIYNLWITHPTHPSMYVELTELKSEYNNLKGEVEKNKEIRWESISNFLWKMIEMVNKYWSNEEKNIVIGVEGCLQELQQIRSQTQKIKDLRYVSSRFEKSLAADLNLPVLDNSIGLDNNKPTPPRINTWFNFRPESMA